MRRCLGCMETFAVTLDVCPHCGYTVGTQADSKNHMEPGTILHDRYTIGKVLGQGGFGITYIAWDAVLDIPVAIKEYMPTTLAYRVQGERTITCPSKEAQTQFETGLKKIESECKTISKFRNLESVVRVYDCFQENRTAYIVMELLCGETVRQIIQKSGAISCGRAIEIITPILYTLQAMHNKQIIHRDIAPDNLFVCHDGKIKLLDFGAARAASLSTDGRTLSVILKEGYAPREQYTTKGRQGPFTDVYAVCATLYHMITGEKPIACLDRTDDAEDFHALFKPNIAPKIRDVLLHGLQLNPQDRYACADELLQALRDAASDQADFMRQQIIRDRSEVIKSSVFALTETPDVNRPDEKQHEEEIVTVRMPQQNIATQSDQPKTAHNPKCKFKKNRKIEWIGGLCGVIILCIAVILILRAKTNTPAPESEVIMWANSTQSADSTEQSIEGEPDSITINDETKEKHQEKSTAGVSDITTTTTKTYSSTTAPLNNNRDTYSDSEYGIIPDLTGMTYMEAYTTLCAAGFLKIVRYDVATASAENDEIVFQQSPPYKSSYRRPLSTEITLSVYTFSDDSDNSNFTETYDETANGNASGIRGLFDLFG